MFEDKQEIDGQTRIPVVFSVNGSKIIPEDKKLSYIENSKDRRLFPYLGFRYENSVLAKVIGNLSIDDERNDDEESNRERTGSRTSFTARKFESYELACCGPRVSHVNEGNANDRTVQNVFSRSALNVP